MSSSGNEKSPIGNLSHAFELTLRQREFEINQLTQRNNFFMIFQGVLIAGLIQSAGAAAALVSFSVCLVGLVVSLFQIGMASGAKYWQMRWERATKTLELWLLEDLKDHPHVTQFFTVDGSHLSTEEKRRLTEVNKTTARAADPLTMDDGAIRGANCEDLKAAAERATWAKRIIDAPVDFTILKKPSVSRIPIYVGIALALFWGTLTMNIVHVDGWNAPNFLARYFTLVPFKADPPAEKK
jgi:hypothetical protein